MFGELRRGVGVAGNAHQIVVEADVLVFVDVEPGRGRFGWDPMDFGISRSAAAVEGWGGGHDG